jgi:hypothetical protein
MEIVGDEDTGMPVLQADAEVDTAWGAPFACVARAR